MHCLGRSLQETTKTHGFIALHHTPLLVWGQHEFSSVHNLRLKNNPKGLHQQYIETATSHTDTFPVEFKKEIITG